MRSAVKYQYIYIYIYRSTVLAIVAALCYSSTLLGQTANGHEYVDLGLSVKWAMCNVGASSPADYGYYFAWGETQPKSEYTYESSKTYQKNIGDISGNSSYDAAAANWGGEWRMPTRQEMQELIDNCTWTWTVYGERRGYKVTSKKNGISIFLPAAGYCSSSRCYNIGENGYYWSASSTESCDYAYFITFNDCTHEMEWDNRIVGRCVRPVLGRAKATPKSSKTIQRDDQSIYDTAEKMPSFPGGTIAMFKWITSHIQYPSEASEKGAQGKVIVSFVVEKDGSLSNAKVERGIDASLDEEVLRLVGAMPKWEAGENGGAQVRVRYTIPVTFTLSGTSSVSKSTTEINGHEYVDLGLSVKWATCNVGASDPEEFGDYFAWGEIAAKTSYTADNSKTYNNSIYNHDIGGKADLDAARANWGDMWRLPTETELRELFNNCKWTWTTRNGVAGCEVTSKKNGNSIFLPAAGWQGAAANHVGQSGRYWSSTPYSGDSRYACSLDFSSSTKSTNYLSCFIGYPVRPVAGPTSKPTKASTSSSSISKTSSSSSNRVSSDATDGHEYVDLGLSVKWATCNLGASRPGDYGSHFAWGEITDKSSYDENNSKTYLSSAYNYDISGKSDLDAARANWGGTWRLPTEAEMRELVNKCTWRWAFQDGTAGYKVTGPSGHSIFLPAAGLRNGSSLYNTGPVGAYWSSTPGKDKGQGAYGLYFSGSDYDVDRSDSRYRGFSIRPVKK